MNEELDSAESIRKIILRATTEEDKEVRTQYLGRFAVEIDEFVDGMSRAFERWRELDRGCALRSRHAHVSALVYSAITLNIESMNLFLAGWLGAAGNVQRQALESIATAFLVCSPDLKVFEQYTKGHYSASKAPAQLMKHHSKFRLNKEAVAILTRSVDFYHNWSHANLMTLATHMGQSGDVMYVGAAFDEGRDEEYQKEASGRASLASIFENIVESVRSNIILS